MLWINHKITTFSITLMLTKNPIISVFTGFISILPDAIEGFNYKSPKWKKNHRKLSHWPIGYLALCITLAYILYEKYSINVFTTKLTQLLNLISPSLNSTNLHNIQWPIILYLLFYTSFGCLLHVIEDSLSATIPLLNPFKRNFKLANIKTGSIREFIISITTLIIALLVFKHSLT